jgi:UDP-glucose 4-epimerase
LGANTNIPLGNKVTDYDLNNCTIATRNVLEAMKQLGKKETLFPSSATVYGDTPAIALSETYGPLFPISLYGAGKLACEGLMSAYSHLFGIRACIFRFANVVGGKMNHGVIFDFIQKLRKNPGELEILGDGKQEKPFFLVEDCVQGMITVFENSDKLCDVYNLGCNTFTPVTRVAQIVMEEMGLKDVKIHCTGGQRGWPGDVPITRFNVDKAEKIGWEPRYDSDGAVRVAVQRILKQLA